MPYTVYGVILSISIKNVLKLFKGLITNGKNIDFRKSEL